MIWTKIHRYGVYALAGAALFGAGSISSTAQYGLPSLWNKAAQVPHLQAENRAIRGAQTHSKANRPTDSIDIPGGINCPMQQGGWRPPMRDL